MHHSTCAWWVAAFCRWKRCISQTWVSLRRCIKPSTFMSPKLQCSKHHYAPVQTEAAAVTEAVCKWTHFCVRQSFTIVTDEWSVEFMMDNRRPKCKNSNIRSWLVELSPPANKLWPEASIRQIECWSRLLEQKYLCIDSSSHCLWSKCINDYAIQVFDASIIA